LNHEDAKAWVMENLPEYVAPAIGFTAFCVPVFRVMPQINLADIVAVQPMSGPAGNVFYLDFNRNSWWNRIVRIVKKIFRRGSSVSRAGR
jgi:hypothetical protein